MRFVDNFSTGTRGSRCAQLLLEHGYAVIFLHRTGSAQPFTAGLSVMDVLSLLTTTDVSSTRADVSGPPTDATSSADVTHGSTDVAHGSSDVFVVAPALQTLLGQLQQVRLAGTLLSIPFQSVSSYLHLLRACALALAPLGRHTMAVMAAAVSDFYVPTAQMVRCNLSSFLL